MRKISRETRLIQEAYKRNKKRIDNIFPGGLNLEKNGKTKHFSPYNIFKELVLDRKKQHNIGTDRNFNTKEAIKKVLWTQEYMSVDERGRRNLTNELKLNADAMDILRKHSGYKKWDYRHLKYDKDSDGYVLGNTLILPIDPSNGILQIVNLVTMEVYIINPVESTPYTSNWQGERPDFWKEYKPRRYTRKHR